MAGLSELLRISAQLIAGNYAPTVIADDSDDCLQDISALIDEMREYRAAQS